MQYRATRDVLTTEDALFLTQHQLCRDVMDRDGGRCSITYHVDESHPAAHEPSGSSNTVLKLLPLKWDDMHSPIDEAALTVLYVDDSRVNVGRPRGAAP